MIRNFVTSAEFYARHRIKNLVSPSEINGILGDAAARVGEELRSRGNNRPGFMLPQMFEDLDPYETKTFTADTTSSTTAGKESGRFVVECTVAPSSAATVTLEGCYDGTPDANTVWIPIINTEGDAVTIDIRDAILYPVQIVTNAITYRYKVVTSMSFTARIYMVDNSIAELIKLKAVVNALLPLIDGTNERIWNYRSIAEADYAKVLAELRAAYDEDGDNVIDTDETSTREVTWLRR